MKNLRHLLETPTARVLLHGGSVLIGRSLDCDVVIADDRVSRHHALVRVTEDAAEVVPLGTHLLTLNGEKVDVPKLLRDGDTIDVAGHAFTLRSEAIADFTPPDPWFIERDPGVLVAVGAERFTVGSGGDDRLVIPGWEAAAVALEVVGDRLTLEVNADGVHVDGPTQPGDIVTLRSGSTVAAKGVSFRALSLPSDPSKPTTRPMFDELPTAVTLTFLPRGGNLSVTVGTRTRRVYLADKRCDLVASLLRPIGPYAVGEVIPDAALSARLWGASRGGRTDINTLVWRVRKDLAAAGMEDVPLLERCRGGVRLRVAEGARVSVLGS